MVVWLTVLIYTSAKFLFGSSMERKIYHQQSKQTFKSEGQALPGIYVNFDE